MIDYYSKISSLLSLVFLLFVNIVLGQELPGEYHLSPDGQRLMRGRQEVKGLYDDKIIRRVDLKFNVPDWNIQLAENYKIKKDLPATLILDGKSYPDVGVRYKGNSSYQNGRGKKKPFNITMDFKDFTQNLKGYETLNFNNSVFDVSFMREVFYENLTRKYGPALKASFIHLFINGSDWGLYHNIQALDGKFIKEWFLSNDGSRWRAQSPGLIDKWKAGLTAMNYLGVDSTVYQQNYTLKHSEMSTAWTDLMKVIKVLNQSNSIDEINKVLDLDRTLWFLAKEIIFEDKNGYVENGGLDYYLYYDKKTARLTPLQSDDNMVMGVELDGIAVGNWDLFYKGTDSLFPLCHKLFNIPQLRQRYLAHVRTMVNDLFRDSIYSPLIDRYFKLIDPIVNKDKIKLMSNYDFVTGRDSLKSWMKFRRNTILNHPEIRRDGINLSDPEYRTAGLPYQSPTADQRVAVRVKASGKKPVKSVIVYYATGFDGPYDKRVMMDDGKNDDSLANDGIYGAYLPAQAEGINVRYYFEAVAGDEFGTVSFEPEGAEHDVYIYRVKSTDVIYGEVVINEVMSANSNYITDQDGEYDDWIELYNTSNKTIDLSNWILTDNPAIPDKYRLPSDTQIAPQGYMVIWADEDGKQNGLHANFKISASGESISLKDANGNMVDHVEIPTLEDNQSYARETNGKGRFVITNPTFNKNNVQVEKSIED